MCSRTGTQTLHTMKYRAFSTQWYRKNLKLFPQNNKWILELLLEMIPLKWKFYMFSILLAIKFIYWLYFFVHVHACVNFVMCMFVEKIIKKQKTKEYLIIIFIFRLWNTFICSTDCKITTAFEKKQK